MTKSIKRILTLCCVLILFLTGCSSKTEKSKHDMVSNDNNTMKKPASDTPTPEVDKGDSTANQKVLIVYFSLTGNTKKLSNTIKDMTGGDIFEIEPDFNYFNVKSRSEMEAIGKKQVEENYRPALKNSVDNWEDYNLILIGSPVWWFSVAPPVMSFLEQYDFTDKKVIPFCTCGSDYGDFFTQIEEAIPDALVGDGLSITDSELDDEEKTKEKLETWLQQMEEN